MTDEDILKERRRFPRLKHRVSVKLKPRKKGYMHQKDNTSDTLNISEEGLCLESAYPFKEGEEFDVEMALAGIQMPIKLSVQVVWKSDAHLTRTTVAGFYIKEHFGSSRKFIDRKSTRLNSSH